MQIQIRRANSSDCEPISKDLWEIWHHFSARQVLSFPKEFSSREVLAVKLQTEIAHWLVLDASTSRPAFFCVKQIDPGLTSRRFGFNKTDLEIQQFSCLQTADALRQQLPCIIGYFPQQSILVRIPATLRDVYWALLKADFTLLGEVHTIIGSIAWLYFDRHGQSETIRAKLIRSRLISRQ